MADVALSGNDVVIINGRSITGLADQNCVELTFDNDIADVKVGKNGNSIYGLNETGKVAKVVMRLVRGSADDKFMNNLLASQQNSFETFVLMNGEFIKKIGDGESNVTSDTYLMSGGIFTKQVEGKTNVEGETEQSVAIYNMKFSNAPRLLT